MLFSKPVGRLLHLFIDCSQLAFAQASNQRFYLSILKKSNARSIASPTLFCLTYLLLLCVTPNWRWLTVYRPIKMPRPLADEVKICDSQKVGFRAGGFSLVPPPPRFAPDRFSRAFKMEPAIANSAFLRDKNTQTACNQAIVNTIHFISVG